MVPPLPRFLLFGDSLTERGFNVDQGGWAARLSHHYIRRADVTNLGHGGYTAVWADALWDHHPTLKHPQRPALCTVFFGANDAANNDRQRTSIEDYRSAMASIVGKAKAYCDHVVVIGPPCVDDERWNNSLPTRHGDRDNKKVGEFSKVAGEVAEANNVPFLDLHAEMLTHANWRAFVDEDGLHFGPLGNKLVFDGLVRIIDQNFTELRARDDEPGALKFAAPHHSDVFIVEPKLSF
jgi:lysophospholipase L1-like esterase